MASVGSWYGSKRAREARLALHFSPLFQRLCVVVMFVSVIGGLAMVLRGNALGWLLFVVTILSYMLLQWRRYALSSLPPGTEPTIESLCSGDVLAHLPKELTPKAIATAVGRVHAGQFMGVRFGITPRFIQEIASDDATHLELVWTKALELKDSLHLPEIDGAMLLVALLLSFPDHALLLAHLKLDEADLFEGIRWYYHLHDLIEKHSRKLRTGGIARDWSFGYIPLLSRFGQNISESLGRGGMMNVELEAHTEALTQLMKTFSESGKQNVALVGPTGVGKTSIVYAFASSILHASDEVPESLRFKQVFLLDSSALLSAAPGRGELENLLTRVLNEAYRAKNIILCLDNAQLFFEEGIGSVDLSNLLLPILEAGRLPIVLTLDEQRFLQIGQRNTALVSALNRVSVAPATESETYAVLRDHLLITEFQQHVTYTYQALQEVYRLSERYMYDLAMPGRAITLLDGAASYAEEGLVTVTSAQKAIEQSMNVKVGVASEAAERDKLLHLEDLIHQRMINQSRAVQVVSDALRRARAGVRNQNRPIGTFLFLGPTGVGKTELAKALASVYFEGEDNLIRLDMNEFVTAEDVGRLIADGADDSGSLTAQVMKKPFSVILLDEIEKAHPQVLTTLLQLLDEGILRDRKNRDVSFRDAIIIATSNAGAERIREYIERGYQLEQFEQQLTSELIESHQFRPEFLNRFDEIVVFRPLNKTELLQVVDLIIAGINSTLEVQKVQVQVSDEAKQFLVDKGYDPRLGARPMRRVVQRAVENTVAKQMLSGAVQAGGTVMIERDQVEAILGSIEQANQIAATPSLS